MKEQCGLHYGATARGECERIKLCEHSNTPCLLQSLLLNLASLFPPCFFFFIAAFMEKFLRMRVRKKGMMCFVATAINHVLRRLKQTLRWSLGQLMQSLGVGGFNNVKIFGLSVLKTAAKCAICMGRAGCHQSGKRSKQDVAINEPRDSRPFI